MAIQSILEQLGLHKKEIAVYLAALELGQASVMRIAKKAGIKRPTAYVTLSNLQEKGYVEIIPKGSSTYYQAVDPEKLLRQFNERVETFKNALPELRSIFNTAPNKPKVRFYEGKKSLTTLYEDEIFRAKDIIGTTSMREIYKIFSREGEMEFLYLMKANKVHLKEILEDSPEARDYAKEKQKLDIGEIKFLRPGIEFNVDFMVYDDKLAMISLKNLIAVVIEDQAISGVQRQLFEMIWEIL